VQNKSLLPKMCRITILSLITEGLYRYAIVSNREKYTFVVNNNMFCVIIIKRSFLCGSLTRKGA
jgi:hypothetical protein